MITKEQYEAAVKRTLQYLDWAGIAVAEEEKSRIEVADFGLSDLAHTGLEILTYVNTDRVCAKELVLFPYQICPEHKHVDSTAARGKEETFRVRRGVVYLYVKGKKIELKPGGQYTLQPNTKHWFQAGNEGAVVSEFSTSSTDETDIFTDKKIERATIVE